MNNRPLEATGLRVSQHAVVQFLARAGSTNTPERARERLERMVARGQEIYKKDATISLLNHGCVEARYILRRSWVLVVVNDVVVTCYQPRLRNFLVPDREKEKPVN